MNCIICGGKGCIICGGKGIIEKDSGGNILEIPEKCLCNNGKINPEWNISKYFYAGYLEKSKNGQLGGRLDSAFFQTICQNSILMLGLLESAAEEIENCYGKETELSKKIREIL